MLLKHFPSQLQSAETPSGRSHRLRVVVFFALLSLTLALAWWTFGSRPEKAQAANTLPFAFYQEFYGAGAFNDPLAAQYLQGNVINGLTFTPPVDVGIPELVNPYGAAVMFRLPGGASPAGSSDAVIEAQRQAFSAQALANPQLTFTWDLMPEWDQSGGAWVPNGRPNYTNLSKTAAHSAFLNYYTQTFPELMGYLSQPATSRPYRLAAVTDFPANTFYAYEMGVDLCMLERGIDELSDLSTGVAFLRGAANQYGRSWGIDLSSWRTSNNMATQYTNSNVMLGGWSASYLSRHYYAAFMSGANVIQNEAATLVNPNGQTNPLNQATQSFADFALRRHPNIGTPVEQVALLVDHNNGFDPKHGIYNQANAVWYQDIPYSNGDFMFDGFLRLAYPNHWLHGLTPGAPFADATGVPNTNAFSAFLANGGDARPYEPMPSTRWGDNLDIITTEAQASALSRYKVIIMVGDVQLNSRLRGDLTNWVSQGGTLLINTSQMTTADQALTGVSFATSSQASASFSRWVENTNVQQEATYTYQPVVPATAQVIAINEVSDPLITRNVLGTGEVLLTTPSYMQSGTHGQFLQICTQLLDAQISRYSPATVSGPAIEYIIGQSGTTIMVTLINNAATPWTGTVSARQPNATAVSEYTSDQNVQLTASSPNSSITATVPAYGARVYAFQYTPASQAQIAHPKLAHRELSSNSKR